MNREERGATRQMPLRRAAIVMLWLVLAMIVAAPGWAMAQSESEGDRLSIGLEPAGRFVGRGSPFVQPPLPAERFIPLVVTLGAGDFGGVLEVEFIQDGTQPAVLILPAAATPDKPTRIPVLAALPEGVRWIKVTLNGQTSEGRRLQASTTFRADRSGADALTFRVAAGERVIFASGNVHPATREDDAEVLEPAGKTAHVLRFDPADLPVEAMGYDAATALVVRVSDLGVRSTGDLRVRAMRAWIASGGRAVLVVDSPSAMWREWLAEDHAGELFVVGQATQMQTPAELRAYPGAPTRFSARPIGLTPQGEAEGWRLDWSTESGEGLFAEGPVGMGWLIVLGIEPATAMPSLDAASQASLWRQVLAKPLAWDAPQEDAEMSPFARRHRSSMVLTEEDRSVTDVLDRMAEIPAVGMGVFWIIAAGMATLALLLGPVDALVLKRLKARQRSWMTALVWIGAASIAAYIGPMVVRTEPTRVNSESFVDVLMPVTPGAEATAWRTSYMGVFASATTTGSLTSTSPRSWWRGISGSRRSVGERAPFRAFATVQMGGSNIPPESANEPNVRFNVWTYRSFLERATLGDRLPDCAPFAASVERAGAEWQVRLAGLPADAQVHSLELLTSGHAHHARMQAVDEGVLEATFEGAGGSSSAWTRIVEMTSHDGRHAGQGARSNVLAERVATGRWALVRVRYASGAGPADLNIRADATHITTVRVLVPLRRGEYEPPVAPNRER